MRFLAFIFLSQCAWAGTPQAMFTMTSGQLAQNTTGYAAPNTAGSGAFNITEGNVQVYWPAAGTWGTIYCNVDVAPGTGQSMTFTFRTNGTIAPNPCIIAGTNTSASAAISSTTAVGDLITIEIGTSATAASGRPRFTILWYPTIPNQYVVVGGRAVNTSATEYVGINSYGQGDTTENGVYSMLSPPGTFSNLQCRVSAASGAAKSTTYTFDANLVATAITASISGATQVQNGDTTHNVHEAAGALIDISQAESGTPAAANYTCAMIFVPDTSGQFPVTQGYVTATAAATHYVMLQGGMASSNATETQMQAIGNSPAPFVKLSKMYAHVVNDPTGTQSFAFSLRVNAASSASYPQCTITGTATTCTDLTDFYITNNNDLMDWQAIGSATAATGPEELGLTGSIYQPSMFPIGE